MPETLLASYYDERIQALSSLLADAQDETSRQVYERLLEQYREYRATLKQREEGAPGAAA
jgi:hypothetical protein